MGFSDLCVTTRGSKAGDGAHTCTHDKGQRHHRTNWRCGSHRAGGWAGGRRKQWLGRRGGAARTYQHFVVLLLPGADIQARRHSEADDEDAPDDDAGEHADADAAAAPRARRLGRGHAGCRAILAGFAPSLGAQLGAHPCARRCRRRGAVLCCAVLCGAAPRRFHTIWCRRGHRGCAGAGGVLRRGAWFRRRRARRLACWLCCRVHGDHTGFSCSSGWEKFRVRTPQCVSAAAQASSVPHTGTTQPKIRQRHPRLRRGRKGRSSRIYSASVRGRKGLLLMWGWWV